MIGLFPTLSFLQKQLNVCVFVIRKLMTIYLHTICAAKCNLSSRSCHSIETALLRVCNDLLLAVDQGNEAVLILLDCSTAFDTMSHKILLYRFICHKCGVLGSALNWFKTYFTNRTQFLNSLSKPHVPLAGVLQRSDIGPLSYHTAPLEDIIKAHGFGRMIYADDTQVYVILKNDSDCSSQLPNLRYV